MKTSVLLIAILTAICANALAQSYRVETIKIPKDIRLEVGGMGYWDDGTLVMCTRRC